ncbi:MAG: 50S ribosomal protein L17 [Parcubacteria group bacterium]|jgi:large subunit ribosomal protein L17
MKHLQVGRKFSRTAKQRKALMNGLLSQLIQRGKINTTLAKAKELKKEAEATVSKIKKAYASEESMDIAKIRILKTVLSKNITPADLKKISQRFAKRNSGFTRLVRSGRRKSDSAEKAILEFID